MEITYCCCKTDNCNADAAYSEVSTGKKAVLLDAPTTNQDNTNSPKAYSTASDSSLSIGKTAVGRRHRSHRIIQYFF